jgi:hypothetical protein
MCKNRKNGGTMTKRFKTIKTSILTGIILISVIIAVSPTISAGPLFNLQSMLNVSWGNETNQPVVPRGELRQLELTITHTVTRGALGQFLLTLYTNAQITIDLQITETPSWCTATLSQGTVSVMVVPNEITSRTTQLSLQVEDNAPAYGLGYVKIKATARQVGFIKGFEQEFTLNFLPDYKPLIQTTLPNTNTKQIGPLDTATFKIDIQNLGNARTKVKLRVLDVPVGWTAIVTDEIILEEGSGSMASAYLTVKPPKGFGYHYDQQTITVSMQPVKADEETKVGAISYASFLVESRGFSTPGFEMVIFIAAFAIVMVTLFMIRKRK